VATTETSDWRVEFSYPGTQRLAAPPRSVAQQGRRVAVNGRGRAGTFTLHGGYRDRNPLPLAFVLNGEPCRAEVLGAVTRDPAGDNSVNAATVEKPTAEPETAQQRRRLPSRRSGNPRRNPVPAPTAEDVKPAPKRSAGFSLAL
jgi:hypothetical protein